MDKYDMNLRVAAWGFGFASLMICLALVMANK